MKIELKQWDPAYAETLAYLANNKNVARNLRDVFPYPYTLSDAQSYIELCRTENPERAMTYAITADGKLAGSVGVFRQSDIYFKCAELGYWLGEAFWNQGIMTEAIRAICVRAFETWDVARIYAEPFAHNAASRRTLEKNGFTLEGVMRNAGCKDGHIFDWCMYALIRGE